jgi:ATP-dependent DNA ligase
MMTSECVVIGYNIDRSNGSVKELLLGSIVDGELKYVGSVTEGIPVEIQQKLSERLPALERKTAFVKCPHDAVWVKPIIGCKASFKSWSEEKLMQQPVLKELLADIDASK